jgi:restriction system protein
MVRKVFEILLEHPDGLPAKEVLDRVEKSLVLTDFEKSNYPNRPNVRRFEKTVRFASIPHVKAGWLVKSRGRWSVTEEGKQAYRQFKDPEQFDREAIRLYRQWEAGRPEDIVLVSEETPGAALALEEAEEMAWTEIQEHLEHMNPYDFQRLVAALLRAMGYHVSWIAPPGPDRGIDILAHTDPLGSSVPRIKVQVKRHEGKINVAGLRSFMAVLGEQDVGLFVCTGGFTSDAEQEARTQEKRKVTLLDLEKLFDLWVKHYEKASEEDKKLLPLRPVYYLAPAE